MESPIPEAYWVEPGFLLAGPYPAPRWAHVTNDKLQRLLQAGIQLFVDLPKEARRCPTIGCYLVRHRLDGAEALEMLRKLRADIPFAHSPSPETDAQQKMVLRWEAGQVNRY